MQANKLKDAPVCGFEGHISIICVPIEESIESDQKQQIQPASLNLGLVEKALP